MRLKRLGSSSMVAASAVFFALAALTGCENGDSSNNNTGGAGGTATTGGAGGMGTGGSAGGSAGANMGGAGGAAATGGAGGLGTIVEVAAANPQFSSLVAAVQKAELVATLSGPGPFTVFAPTNAAFTALLMELRTSLDALSKDDLRPILTYHVVSGAVPASQVVGLKVATTVNGADFRISVEGQSVRLLTGRAEPILVTATDVPASNGVIHVIDAVMLPPGNVPTVVMAKPELSTLVQALVRAQLVDTLSGPGPFTVFAPTNAAFAAFLAANPAWQTLNDIPMDQLANVLRYHVVAAKSYSEQIAMLSSVNTLAGPPITIDARSGVKLNGDSNVTAADVLAKNGVVHVIDKVLLPPSR